MMRRALAPLFIAALGLSAIAHADTPEAGWVPASEAIPLTPTLPSGSNVAGDGRTAVDAPADVGTSIAPPTAAPGLVPIEAPVAPRAPGAATTTAIPEDLPAAGATVGEGDAAIRVTVRGHSGDAYDAPLEGQAVELSVIRPPHEVLQRLVALTGDDGVAHFAVEAAAGLQAFARNLQAEREVFAPVGVALDDAGEYTLEIQDIPVVADASVVFAPRVVTIAELWEDYIVFTQIFTLATDQPVIFEAEKGGRDAGLRIPLPDGAAGVRVIQPQAGAESVGDAVMFRGQILPAGEGDEAPSLIVRYSLRHNNVKSVAWDQVFAFDVENLSLVVPQTSPHDRHPRLNVDLAVPMCADDGSSPRDVMCFAEYADTAEGVQMLQGSAVRLARGGRVAAGGTMSVVTTGWPADPHIGRWATGAAAILALLLGVLLVRRASRGGRGTSTATERLEREKREILRRVDALEQQLADAAILELDYEAERERIVGELALIERRIRSIADAGGHA